GCAAPAARMAWKRGETSGRNRALFRTVPITDPAAASRRGFQRQQHDGKVATTFFDGVASGYQAHFSTLLEPEVFTLLRHAMRGCITVFGIWMSDGNQLPPAGETACPTDFAKRLIQQGGAGGFACRSN